MQEGAVQLDLALVGVLICERGLLTELGIGQSALLGSTQVAFLAGEVGLVGGLADTGSLAKNARGKSSAFILPLRCKTIPVEDFGGEGGIPRTKSSGRHSGAGALNGFPLLFGRKVTTERHILGGLAFKLSEKPTPSSFSHEGLLGDTGPNITDIGNLRSSNLIRPLLHR